MPEGHTIHRIAKDHTPLLVGRPVEVSSPQGRFAADAAVVNGHVLERIEAYGKHLFYWWANGVVGHVHLGLFGKFRVHRGAGPHEPLGQVRMRLATELATVDLAGPTDCTIGTSDDRDAIVARLGPDPLRRDAKPKVAIERIASSRQAIGALLLDQRVLAGVGNVYRAEALFVHGIHPVRAGRDCELSELQALWTTIVSMLRQGVKDNRIVTLDRREFDIPADGRPRRGDTTYVYHRDTCLRCGTPVATVALAGRPCYFCPTCQPR
ncbi:MAG TPA: DNA glycosylase [Acidimicrobiaceae bacterium]|nr:DNA glycosylase [Acidimicrobiaceae bacterium]